MPALPGSPPPAAGGLHLAIDPRSGGPRERLDRHTTVVLDEAAIVGTRKLARLLAYADQAGAKVLMIGDDKQLASID